MTREEAIECLNYQNEKFFGGQSEALKMAIMALSEELSEDGTLTVHVSDGSKVKRVLVMGDNIFGGLYYPDSAKTPKNGERFSCPNCGFKADWYIPDSAENEGDTVSRAAYEQIMWERDIAVQQLKELGYGLGEKPEENKGESEDK